MRRKKYVLALSALLSLTMLIGCNNQQASSSSIDSEPTPIPASDVSGEDVDQQYAQEVIDLINSLGSDSTEEDVEYVIAKYNDLTDRQKLLVTNYDMLALIGKAVIINKKLNSLNENDYVIEEVMEVRELYDEFVEEFGEQGIAKIKSEYYTKLTNIEVKITNSYVDYATAILTDDDMGFSLYSLVAHQADAFYNRLDESLIEKITNYDAFLNRKEALKEKGYLLYDDGYQLDTSSPNKDFTPTYDDTFGKLYSYSGLSLTGDPSIHVDLNVSGLDWHKVYSMSFFLQADSPIDNRTALIPNESWADEDIIWANPQVVDSINNIYYYQFDLTKLKTSFDAKKKTYFQIYFGATSHVTSVKMTDLVAINKDYSEVNALVGKINQIDVSTNMGKAQFLLQNQIVSQLIDEEEGEFIQGFDIYMEKQNIVNNSMGITYDLDFTTYFNSDWPAFTKTSDETFGYISNIELPSDASNNIQIFTNHGNGKDWSMYSKVGMFVKIDCPLKDQVMFVINNKESLKDMCTPVQFGTEGYIYYLEFNINTDTAFTGNPFIKMYFDGTTRHISTTDWVGIK